jgi:phosphatidate cytidylyltransferase
MQRLVSGVALGALALAAILVVPASGLRLLACAVAVLAADEYLRLVTSGGSARRVPWLVLTAATAWVMAAPSMPTVLLAVAAVVAGAGVERVVSGRAARDAAWIALTPWYVGAPLGLLAGVHALGGPALTLLLLAAVVVSDSGQYYTGRAVGRTPLAPVTSPKKTIEGAAGGVVLAAVFLGLVGPRVVAAGAPALAVLGAGLAVVGIAGDLFESRLKRAAGVKDSGALIPGHGGVLDRVDALLFATPVFYVCVRSLT